MGRTFKIQNELLKNLTSPSNTLLEEDCQDLTCGSVSHLWVATLLSIKGQSPSNTHECVQYSVMMLRRRERQQFSVTFARRDSWWSRPSHQLVNTSNQLPWACPSLRPQISILNLNTQLLEKKEKKKRKIRSALETRVCTYSICISLSFVRMN